MTEQPTALRLADALDTFHNPHDKQAAAELRRLHAENEKFRKHIEGQNKELDQLIPMAEKLEAQRGALLEALKLIQHATSPTPNDGGQHEAAHDIASAAIAKAEEA